MSPTARVLDLGCGYGAIGIVAAKLAVRGSVTLVDSDIRGTRLAERNIALNGITNAEVILGDGTKDLPKKARFDLVASNPPTHNGREVLDEFVAGAYSVLRPRGQLVLVVNRLLSLRQEVERVFGNVEQVARSGGFIVVRAVKTPILHGEVEGEEGETSMARKGRVSEAVRPEGNRGTSSSVGGTAARTSARARGKP